LLRLDDAVSVYRVALRDDLSVDTVETQRMRTAGAIVGDRAGEGG
jgi:hypothetical protein